MRLRTATASAALVLATVMGAAACSSSPTADAERPPAPTAPAPAEGLEGLEGKIETGKRAAGEPELNEQSVAGPAKCATSAADIPEDCALDLTFAEFTEGERAEAPPTLP
ncbi:MULTISPECIES: hypothetical protein [Streptomyces]|uniref:DUF3558 domain-containing protein n=1 Tax=Streptomyces globisporus TaxID=1908 RepID=A0A927BMK9_STRGL|nr:MULTISPECIES: hypothetical protein [Streptomyces]MBD2829436.1 hypothetical protein [Streptomyces globisporus]NEA09867.1 hypothetical protein [Streptomyces sp. SID10692]KOU04222.1 hypothetical protein ADK88_22430 [Streptomyces sp. NRRL F-2295]MCC0577114.1 hypothetical protein [Streptomyces californicus]MDW4917870.1 hypothetical protein [Streptomyces californicus]